MVQRARILALVSSANRTPVIIVAAILSVLLFGLDGCYSFRGTSIPPHLKTISVSSVVDNSGFGSG